MDIQEALLRLAELGVTSTDNWYDTTPDYHSDYNKIPLENINLADIEKPVPKKGKVISKHTIIVDSRQRDYNIYPLPNSYMVELMEPHKNVERIELIAAMMPKTSYNVTSENNLMLVSVGGTNQQVILTPGQYLVGSNQLGKTEYIANGTSFNFGLLKEVKDQLNKLSLGFNVFLVTAPFPKGTGNNAAVSNRIMITCSSSFSIDFTNTGYSSGSPFRLLGFQKKVYKSGFNTIYCDDIGTPSICYQKTLTDSSSNNINHSILSDYDYDLMDDPKYIIMQLEFGNRSVDRIESIDVATNQKFAIVIYDANDPDNIQNYNSNTVSDTSGIINQQDRKPGRLKALKGADFDKKIIDFKPPIALDNFKITFTKYDNTGYDFNNREHLLTFEIDVADYDPSYRY